MKALVLEAYNSFVYRDYIDPALRKPDDVLIRVRAAAICGSDVHGMDGSTGRRIPPIVMGHEAAGEVAEVGRDVRGFAPGDRVTFDSTEYCGSCFHCKRGEVNLCDNRRVLGVSCSDYRRDGCFAEYVVVPERILYRLPDSLDFAAAAIAEPAAVAAHAAALTPFSLGDSITVVGAGLIGLVLIQILRASSSGRIVALDTAPERRAAALELGADF
ncbi:MAG TPA: alcohol dehydrogenase catalytic domain-containing protein, partial [Rectinemataceae bacterium]